MKKGGVHGEGGMRGEGGMCGEGGMHGEGGHAWCRVGGACVAQGGGHAWYAPPPRYGRSLRGRYASYWNAFLFGLF